MNNYDAIRDIGMTYDGDFMLTAGGDIAFSNGLDCVFRDIVKILRTNNPEWVTHPRVGADLDTFIGESNTRETGKNIEKTITDAISIQYPFMNVTVRVVPTGKSSIRIFLTLLDARGSGQNVLQANFDLASDGISISTDPTFGTKDTSWIDTQHKQVNNPYLQKVVR